jgi:glycosyltransferase involved in cell wall biosynthesis
VVIPTYNRGRLLNETIPTYLQDEVARLVLVDDCSVDDTPRVARELAERYAPRILYVRNETNRKQAYSKNRGKALADTPYLYFGDDDSVLLPRSLAVLLETSRRFGANVVGAAALYCRPGQSVADAVRDSERRAASASGSNRVDMVHLRFDFGIRSEVPVELPVTHSCFLIERDWASRFSFDTRYTGNCYREETDFLLTCKLAGAKILFDSRAVQVNLPRGVTVGGARAAGRMRYEWHSALNTLRFVRKHRRYFEDDVGVWHVRPFLSFLASRVAAAWKVRVV